MNTCKICTFKSDSFNKFNNHFSGKRHLNALNKLRNKDLNLTICEYCGGSFKYSSNFYHHRKYRCEIKKEIDSLMNQSNNKNIIKDLMAENEKLKFKLGETQSNDKMNTLELSSILKGNTSPIILIQNNNTINNNTNSNNNNTLITNNKIQNLNNHCSDVVDIDTFLENYKTKYALSEDQSRILLENYKMSGIKSFGKNLYYYLETNYLDYLNSESENDYSKDELVLPFLCSDASLRTHMEKIGDEWKHIRNLDKIKKIIIISNDQIYKYHNDMVPMTDYERLMIANSLLRNSCYSKAQDNMKKKLTQ